MTKSRIFKVLFFVLVVGGGLIGAFVWLSITINNSRFPPSSRVSSNQRSLYSALLAYDGDNGSFPPVKWVDRGNGIRHPAISGDSETLVKTWINTDGYAMTSSERPPMGYFNVGGYAILVSVGPDQDFDTRWIQIDRSLSAKDQARALSPITYDPTNGTKSNGDVYLIVEPTLADSSTEKSRVTSP